MKKYITLLLLISNLFSQTPIEPDSYTAAGYCIVETKNQKILGLSRFKTNKEFIDKCKGVMIFKYKKDSCRYFTMEEMNFHIYIEDKYEKTLFKIGQIKKVCGKTIIEYSTTLN